MAKFPDKLLGIENPGVIHEVVEVIAAEEEKEVGFLVVDDRTERS